MFSQIVFYREGGLSGGMYDDCSVAKYFCLGISYFHSRMVCLRKSKVAFHYDLTLTPTFIYVTFSYFLDIVNISICLRCNILKLNFIIHQALMYQRSVTFEGITYGVDNFERF